MNAVILASNHLELIETFKRAVLNYNTTHEDTVADSVLNYNKHYREPAFLIPNIHVTLDVQEEQVVVTTSLDVIRNADDLWIVLNGVGHVVDEVMVNGETLDSSKYNVTPNELILLDPPAQDSFTVKITSKINPFINKSGMGLYQCGKWLSTQCESEGARKIFFTSDRPDVLSRYTTTIIANPEKYPFRLSNGNLVDDIQRQDGRTEIIWEDPFPKPSYLFACVLGDFAVLEEDYITRSGRKVKLQVYVEKGKESRATFSLSALQNAMKFDEEFFDREYDLDYLKMVAMPDFNMGAMENKGLMIFNDRCLLVDSESGTDAAYRRVAHVIAHEYFHNWSGNRVTVRNWFELALKEAFTDFRAMLFSAYQYGDEIIRPAAVTELREGQFPEETSPNGHPLMVESFLNSSSIYDGTTYTKGREVFRALMVVMDTYVEDGFRKAQNIYFTKNDGKAVTFRALIDACNEVLAPTGQNLDQFERWFTQQGTPIVDASMDYNPETKQCTLTVKQSCPHPRSREKQEPFQIPFSYECIDNQGNVLVEKTDVILSKKKEVFQFQSNVEPTPIFLHDFCAPVIMKYGHTLNQLGTIAKFSRDPFSAWEAGQQYALMAMEKMFIILKNNQLPAYFLETYMDSVLPVYADILTNDTSDLLAKAQLLALPSIRALAQHTNCYDFALLEDVRSRLASGIAKKCKNILRDNLAKLSVLDFDKLSNESMKVRAFKNAIHFYLAKADTNHLNEVYKEFSSTLNFNDYLNSFSTLIVFDTPLKKQASDEFYAKWKGDMAVFNSWLGEQASSPSCTVEDLIHIERHVEGYSSQNPNHIRSTTLRFIHNLPRYHDAEGKGYKYVVDRILEVEAFNPQVASGNIAADAFLDFEKLPPKQRQLMAKELERLKSAKTDSIRDLANRLLK